MVVDVRRKGLSEMQRVDDAVARTVLDGLYEFEHNHNLEDVNRTLRDILTKKYGLGSALLAAWGHAIGVQHVPLAIGGSKAQVGILTVSRECDYAFVHVPVREHRNDNEKLAELGILEEDPDPLRLVYHEDGLVFSLTFQQPELHNLSVNDITEIIRSLHQQNLLHKASIHNRQVQFKDLGVKRLIELTGESVYVVDHHRLATAPLRLPAGLGHAVDYVRRILAFRKPCNYCSISALNPREATLYSTHVDRLDTARKYQFGFTFAPFGDPLRVCHFLAWDTPSIDDVVMNMDPQSYSFSDLIRLVYRINRDLMQLNPPDEWEPLAGFCNHWAGNSIYHQHYQFFRIANIPLLNEEHIRAGTDKVEYRGVTVKRLKWPTPAYLITSAAPGLDPNLLTVAQRVAQEWDALSEGYNTSYGNGIPIQFHSQNIYVRVDADHITAIFIPRHRKKLNAKYLDFNEPRRKKPLEKGGAGTLEMMGYFILDKPDDFERVNRMDPKKRQELGTEWLSQLAPDAQTVAEFERNLVTALHAAVAPHQARIDQLARVAPPDLGRAMWEVATFVRRDPILNDAQRQHLYLRLLSLNQGPSFQMA